MHSRGSTPVCRHDCSRNSYLWWRSSPVTVVMYEYNRAVSCRERKARYKSSGGETLARYFDLCLPTTLHASFTMCYFIYVISLKLPLDFALAASFTVNHETCVPSMRSSPPPHTWASHKLLIVSRLIDLIYSSPLWYRSLLNCLSHNSTTPWSMNFLPVLWHLSVVLFVLVNTMATVYIIIGSTID